MIRAGGMTYRLAFDRPTVAPNGQGGQLQGWEEAYRCAAHILFLRGGEVVQAARLAGRQPAVMTVRSCSLLASVTPEWRLRDVRAGTIWNIRSIVRTQDRAFYELTCESGVAT